MRALGVLVALATRTAVLGTGTVALATRTAVLGTGTAVLGTGTVALGTGAAVLGTGAVVLGTSMVSAADVGKLGVDFTFAPKNKCAGMSPEIRLSDVPPATKSYDVKLTDLDVPDFRHWSQTLPAAGPIIREGAGAKYYGPCPPGGAQHRYRIDVTALDAAGTPLAKGDKTVTTGR